MPNDPTPESRSGQCRPSARRVGADGSGAVRSVSPVTGLVHQLLGVPGWVVLLVVGGLVLAEDAVFVGFVVPGETAAIIGGASAKLGHVSLTAVMATVVLAAIVGDSIGYEVGKHLGGRALRAPLVARHRDRLDAAQGLLARRGGPAVFLGRWVAFFRAMMPALAGISQMRYRVFLLYNAAGGIVWGVVVVLVGYLAGASYARVERYLGPTAAGVATLVVIAGVVVLLVRRRAGERDDAKDG